MKNLYGELDFKLKKINLARNLELRYFFEYFSEEEINIILQYSDSKFENYVKFILDLLKVRLVFSNEKKIKRIKQITKLMYDNKNNQNVKDLKYLLINTNVLNNEDILDFSIKFLTIKNNFKARKIVKVLLKIDLFGENSKNLLKVLLILDSIDDNHKLSLISSLLSIPKFINNDNLSDLIDFIKRNSYSKYLKHIPTVLRKNPSLLNSTRLYNIVNTFMNINNDLQADILLTIIKNRVILENDLIFERVIKYIQSNKKNKNKYLLNLLNNETEVDNLLDILEYLEQVEYDFQADAIIKITAYRNISNNRYEFKSVIETILSTNKSFQVDSFLRFLKNVDSNILNEYSIITFLNKINKSKYEYQLNTIFDLLSQCMVNEYLKEYIFGSKDVKKHSYGAEIVDLINKIENEDVCLNITTVLKSSLHLLSSSNSMSILKKYALLKSKEQILSFISIISKYGFIESEESLNILSCLILANPYQAMALGKIVLDNKHDYNELSKRDILKYLLVSKNPQTICYISAIILGSYNIDEMEKLIKVVLESKLSLTHIRNTIFNNSKYESYLVKMENMILGDNITLLDKVKMKLKK